MDKTLDTFSLLHSGFITDEVAGEHMGPLTARERRVSRVMFVLRGVRARERGRPSQRGLLFFHRERIQMEMGLKRIDDADGG